MKDTVRLDAGALEDIPRPGARCVKTAQGAIGIFRTSDDELFALRDECPHAQGELSQGVVQGTSVICPLHGWIISLQTGEAEPPDEGATATYEVWVEDGRVILALPPA